MVGADLGDFLFILFSNLTLGLNYSFPPSPEKHLSHLPTQIPFACGNTWAFPRTEKIRIGKNLARDQTAESLRVWAEGDGIRTRVNGNDD